MVQRMKVAQITPAAFDLELRKWYGAGPRCGFGHDGINGWLWVESDRDRRFVDELSDDGWTVTEEEEGDE